MEQNLQYARKIGMAESRLRSLSAAEGKDVKDGKGVNMKKIIQFIKESHAELKKVVWPGRDDVISSVKVVIVSTVIVAAVLGLIDFILLLGIRAIF